jgi:hypothetical protein
MLLGTPGDEIRSQKYCKTSRRLPIICAAYPIGVRKHAHHSGSKMPDMKTHAESMLQEPKNLFNYRHVVRSRCMEALTYFIDGEGNIRPCEGKIL